MNTMTLADLVRMYRDLRARGWDERDAAAAVDHEAVRLDLVRRLHREPTEAEIENEMQKL